MAHKSITYVLCALEVYKKYQYFNISLNILQILII